MQTQAILSWCYPRRSAVCENDVLKPSTRKHFDLFCELLGVNAKSKLYAQNVVSAPPIILTGYQPGRPPKTGILIHYNNYVYFCQKSRFRNTLISLCCDRVASMSVSQCLHVTTISLSSFGFKLDFVSKDSQEPLTAFLRRMGENSTLQSSEIKRH